MCARRQGIFIVTADQDQDIRFMPLRLVNFLTLPDAHTTCTANPSVFSERNTPAEISHLAGEVGDIDETGR